MNGMRQPGQRLLTGVAASPGIAIGKAVIYCPEKPEIVSRPISAYQIKDEITRFEEAIESTCVQLEQIRKEMNKKKPDGEISIFDAYILLATDPEIKKQVVTSLNRDMLNIEFIFKKVISEYIEAIGSLPNPFFSERASDINDVAERILHNLTGFKNIEHIEGNTPTVLVAEQLSPSDTAGLVNSPVIGFVTEEGSLTSHTAIMAKNMQLPAILDVRDATRIINPHCEIIIDGYKGKVIVNPTRETIEKYQQLKHHAEEHHKEEMASQFLPCRTTDGHEIMLSANIQHPDDANQLQSFNPYGIGLFRTEYLFINRTSIPNEEEQFEAYRHVLSSLSPSPVIIRTIDLGGDKLSMVLTDQEDNPFLGTRGIRLCLTHPQLLKTQLKALLRASVYGKLKIMYPMISSIEEIIESNKILEEAKDELARENKIWSDNFELGVMMEVPSSTVIADRFCPYVDFFSIGTNDLCQYLLGVDRTNANLAHLYQQSHPAMIRVIYQLVKTSNKHNCPISLCGEMGSDILYIPLLLGCGLKELSMNPGCIPAVRATIRALSMKESEELTLKAMQCDTAEEVRELCRMLFQSQEKLQHIWHQYRQKDDF